MSGLTAVGCTREIGAPANRSQRRGGRTGVKGGREPRSRWCPRHQRPALLGARRKDEPTVSEPAQEAERPAAAEPLPGADSPARWVPGLRAEVSVDWVLPQLGVRDRRQMFNRAAAGSIWVTAASCAVVGREHGRWSRRDRRRGAGADARGPRLPQLSLHSLRRT